MKQLYLYNKYFLLKNQKIYIFVSKNKKQTNQQIKIKKKKNIVHCTTKLIQH